MKKNRQEAIIELIQQYPIETQEELLSRLNQIGFKTTQATISRDIRELALIKKPDADGKQIYCLIDQEDETSRKYQRILAEAIISMELAENMLVVKTVSGMAMASAAALDSLNIIGMVGTIAGDDTIMCVMKDKNIGRTAIAEIDHMIKKFTERKSMLQNLHVKNLALINELEITFDEHLNILTGETGAGKSVLIGSIESALGKKISKDMIRPGAKEAVIELLFWIEDQKLIKEIEALDLEVEDGQIFIKRVINEKRSINKINDSTVTLNTLREVSRRLFDLHGQQEHQVLLKEKNHLSMMDHFLPENARYSLEQCKNLAGEYHEISTKIKEISIDDQQRLREMDFLKHEISEIENANLVKGEDEELETVYQKIVHSRDIIISCQAARMLTGYEEETSIGNQLSESIRRMQEISHLDPQISEFYEQLLSVEDLLNGFHQELTTYMENMEFDEQTYQEVEERLNVINSLKDKYGPSIEDVTAYGQKAEKRYNMLCDAEHEIEILKNEQERIRERYLKEAKNLSEQRCKVAKTLGSNITKALEDLNFLDVRFEIEVTKKDQISADGMDQIRFMISTNPGLPMRPVQEVASGGELSRIMLALKSVAAQADGVDTLIFDEIDTGISGETANRVAKKMAVISKDHQVIAITHLPQIAAMADSHYFIRKQTDQKNTQTMIRKLNESESLKEISRMISGDQWSETSMEHAKEMKSLADETKLY